MTLTQRGTPRGPIGTANRAGGGLERYGIWGATLPEERRSMRASAANTSPTMRIKAAS